MEEYLAKQGSGYRKSRLKHIHHNNGLQGPLSRKTVKKMRKRNDATSKKKYSFKFLYYLK